ncbi:hypothetical protein [robinz microvirus RP_61]|nr:hypothetical protein [robinz microvirus RP_61]
MRARRTRVRVLVKAGLLDSRAGMPAVGLGSALLPAVDR